MNFYTITFRLSSDPKFTKRYWEGFADSKDSAVSSLSHYCVDNIFKDDLFPPTINILRFDEYLSIFK